MKDTKTRKTPRLSSSQAREIRLTAPSSWRELTQAQLRYVLELMTTHTPAEVKTYMLFRLCGLEWTGGGLFKVSKDPNVSKGFKAPKAPAFPLVAWQVESLIHQFDFIDDAGGMDVRLNKVCGHYAVDPLLHGVPFVDYLNAEKAYQGYVASLEIVPLKNLCRILYNADSADFRPSKAELLGAFLWYTHVKRVMGKAFRHLFRPSSGAGDYDPIKAMNAEIRALTGGDVTKEAAVLHTDCWRALTELDELARESEELKKNRHNAKS